jgi:GntR family transcriptional regulator
LSTQKLAKVKAMNETGVPAVQADGVGVKRGGTQPIALYEQLKRQISERILLGHWAPGTILPGEQQLARDFGVAVGTVRRALADLTGEGLLMRRPKTGTVVTGRSPHHSLRFFFQYFRLHGEEGELLRSTAQVLSVEQGEIMEAEQALLQAKAGAQVIRLHRLRSVAGRPVMHQRMVFQEHRVPDFPVSAVPELLYRYLLEEYGIRISSIRESVAADLATEEDARLLHVKPPTPILLIEEVSYDQAGQPVIIATSRALTDRYRYMNEVR